MPRLFCLYAVVKECAFLWFSSVLLMLVIVSRFKCSALACSSPVAVCYKGFLKGSHVYNVSLLWDMSSEVFDML